MKTPTFKTAKPFIWRICNHGKRDQCPRSENGPPAETDGRETASPGRSDSGGLADTAALRNSANTRAIDGKGYVEVIVSYGTEYGIYVHENLDAHHDVGQAKFLEQPFRELRSDILQMVKDAING
jgi:hypothetical protein